MNPRRLLTRLFIAALLSTGLAFFLASCASTTVENGMAESGVTKLSFKKLVVIASVPDAKVRRQAEDALVARIHRAECIPSYKILPAEKDLNDHEKVKAAVVASGADGVLVLKMLSYQTETDYTEGKVHDYNVSVYAGYAGYGGYGGYPGYYGAGVGYGGEVYSKSGSRQDAESVSSTKVLQIFTKVFDVAGNRMVWSGRVISNNPSTPTQIINDAVEAIRKDMEASDLIPATAK